MAGLSGYKAANYRDDSDADDEYERSVATSPTLCRDFESSPTDSDAPSTENTPTTFTHSREKFSPRGVIADWSADQCADFIAELGLGQYADSFVDEAITGDALIALVHADLKEMGISSIGHRLTILKGVYDIKVKQNIPIEPEHYVPLSVESDTQDHPPTHDDIARIIHIIKDRDAELRSLRDDLIRISEENRKLREDILPLVKVAKDRSQPLPERPDPIDPPPPETKGNSLSRKFSKRLFLSNSTPKNPSPTTIQEGRPLMDNSSLDPSAAALAASSHLTASIRDASQPSPNQPQPSPTSPAYRDLSAPGSGGPPSRPFPRSDNIDYSGRVEAGPLSAISLPTPALMGSVSSQTSGSMTTPPTTTPSTVSTTPGSGPAQAGANGSTPQVEVFKSFRVSIDDPCHKVLPVALKKYNITADWRQYALYIVHGDQERCLGLNERPLILFKQLDKEGRKPMFMLRKHAAPIEGHVNTVSGGGTVQGPRVDLPGGVL